MALRAVRGAGGRNGLRCGPERDVRRRRRTPHRRRGAPARAQGRSSSSRAAGAARRARAAAAAARRRTDGRESAARLSSSRPCSSSYSGPEALHHRDVLRDARQPAVARPDSANRSASRCASSPTSEPSTATSRLSRIARATAARWSSSSTDVGAGASEASCRRIDACSRCSAGPGSMPRSSTSRVATLGLNIQFGYAGVLNFAGSSFFGIGAYTSAVFNAYTGVPHLLVLLIGGLLAALIGSLLLLPVLRTRGHYAAVVTIAFACCSRLLPGQRRGRRSRRACRSRA